MSKRSPEQALVTVEGRDAPPTLEAAARQLGVAVGDVDAGFGVIPVDPRAGLYAVRVRADRLPAGFAAREPFQGPWSEPEIAPLRPGRGEREGGEREGTDGGEAGREGGERRGSEPGGGSR